MPNKRQELDFLLRRAGEHLVWLRENVVHPDANISAENMGYYVIPSAGDAFAGKIKIVIGEHVGSLRNALNYLTCAVAEQDSGRIGKQVQFPIESSPDSFAAHRNSYLEGVLDEHLALFKRYQPCFAPDVGWISLLRDLSNWYRHKGLIRIQKVFQRPPRLRRHRHRKQNNTGESACRWMLSP
jgi:hypothetical protein